MKFILLLTVLLFSMADADSIDDQMKRQCQYIVFGNGNDNLPADMYMVGMVSGQMYRVDERTAFAKDASQGQIKERACKEALNNNSARAFLSKYNWGISVTIDINSMEYRTVQ